MEAKRESLQGITIGTCIAHKSEEMTLDSLAETCPWDTSTSACAMVEFFPLQKASVGWFVFPRARVTQQQRNPRAPPLNRKTIHLRELMHERIRSPNAQWRASLPLRTWKWKLARVEFLSPNSNLNASRLLKSRPTFASRHGARHHLRLQPPSAYIIASYRRHHHL